MAGPRIQPRPRVRASDTDPGEQATLAPGAPDPTRYRWSEPGQVLQELDDLTAELLPRRGSEASPTPSTAPLAPVETPPEGAPALLAPLTETAAPPESAPPVGLGTTALTDEEASDEEPPDEDETPPTLYLEERLRLANLALSGFGKGIRELDDRWNSLRQTAETLSQEIQRAQRELEFVRGARPAPDRSIGAPAQHAPPPEPAASGERAGATIWPTGRVAFAARRLEGRPLPSAFGEFTANRYNRTIGDLKARRKKLAGYTVGFAALISIGLLILTAIAREPTPPFWVAALPAVWMVPVPFFIASFRGTHRVLRRNHLELPAD